MFVALGKFCFIFLIAPSIWALEDSSKNYNLIFIMFDDLRPDLSIYGNDFIHTPNFDRLASKSIVFDKAYCQVAVCNPSRDSLLTGLRPEKVGTLNFGHTFGRHLTLPSHLMRAGYNTAGIGKIYHWENNEKHIWNFDSWDNYWYDYQNKEAEFMKSSVMPDKETPLEEFRDYKFVTRAIDTLKKLILEPKPYMLGLGFKMPHLSLHVPYQYYEMYKNKSSHWELPSKQLHFPVTTPEISYRCCAEIPFRYMNHEGEKGSEKSSFIGDINHSIQKSVRDEIMIGYSAAISFVDSQLGRFLDALDEMKLWDNVTFVLTSDHGMHNGEKGIWEKWTLFEESTRFYHAVPLLISHPKSPFKGKRYDRPVELVDIYATLIDILNVPDREGPVCDSYICKPLDGISLAPAILGNSPHHQPNKKSSYSLKESKLLEDAANEVFMPQIKKDYAISQVLRCGNIGEVDMTRTSSIKFEDREHMKSYFKRHRRASWNDCSLSHFNATKEVSMMGYSLRTSHYRYTAYFHYNMSTRVTDFSSTPIFEELYDHKKDPSHILVHGEDTNLIFKYLGSPLISNLRSKIIQIMRQD